MSDSWHRIKGNVSVEAVITMLLTIMTLISGYATTQISDLAKNVGELNAKMAVVISRTDTSDRRMDNMDERLTDLENTDR